MRATRLCAQGLGYVKTEGNTQASLHRVRVVGSQGSFSSRGTVVRIAKKETSDGNYCWLSCPARVAGCPEFS